MKPSQIGGVIMDDLNMKINLLENRPMWIDDSEIQSVTSLCVKCRRMKEEHHIQFAVIDDFLNMPIPESVLEGRNAPDAVYNQLCQLAMELDIVVVALLDSSVFHPTKTIKTNQ
jgi:replicative DNA helicase